MEKYQAKKERNRSCCRLQAALLNLYKERIILVTVLLLMLSTQLCALINQEVTKPDTLYLGSRFELNLTSDAEILDVMVPDTIKAFAINAKEPIKEKGKPAGMKLIITALDTGEQVFPALEVKQLSPVKDTDKTKPFRLNILETRAAQDSVLADIAPLRRLWGQLPYWAYFIIPLLLVLALIYGIYWYLRRRRKKLAAQKRTAPAMIDNRPNWKKALEDLYQLNQQQLPLKGEFIAYHFRLSEIMKLYLEADYGFPANEMTTREIKHYIKTKKNLLLHEQEKLFHWLEDCDRVKFAKHLPALEDCEEKMDWFMRWLMHHRKTNDNGSNGAVE